MKKKYKVLSNVLSYDVGNDILVTLSKDRLDMFDENLVHLQSCFENGLYDFIILRNDKILYSIINPDSTYEFELANDKKTLKEYTLHLPGIIFSSLFYCLSDYKGERGTLELDIETLKISRFWNSPMGLNGISTLNGDMFFSFKRNLIAGYKLEEREPIWQIDISKLGSYINIHGKRQVGEANKMCIHGNILIAEITGIFLLGIDSSNGSILWKHHFNSNLSFSFSTYDGSLHVFSYGTYSQIDILTGELLQIKALETDFKSLGFSVVGHTAPAVSEKYIVLASSFEALAIIIDRTNLQIIQRLELSGNYVPQTNTPKFHDNRLYILDAHNTLHIFEDE